MFDLEVNTFQPNMYLIKVSDITIEKKIFKIHTVMNETKNKGEFKLKIPEFSINVFFQFLKVPTMGGLFKS